MSPHPSSTRPWLTADEAADYLQVTRRTLDRYRAAGILPAFRIGTRAVRFRLSDLDAMLGPISTGGGADDAA